MVEVDASVNRVDELVLVQATVTNTHTTPQVVRLESQLDGPTWAPQHSSVAAPSWDDGVWEQAIQPERSVGVGFASPADPVEPPLELVNVERATEEDFETPAQVLAKLDKAVPPRRVFGDQL